MLFFYDEEFLARPNLQAGGLALVGCPLLPVQHILTCPPYMKVFKSIRNLRTRHAVLYQY
jgi:hypothetical protein